MVRTAAIALLLTASLCQAAEPRVAYSLHCYAPGTGIADNQATPQNEEVPAVALASVKAGAEFDLVLSVQDLRPEVDGMIRGVFAAYCNSTFSTRYVGFLAESYAPGFPNGRHCFPVTFGLSRWGAFTNGSPGNTDPVEVSRARLRAKWPATVGPSITQATVIFRVNFNNLQAPADNTLVLGTLKTASPAVYFPGEEPTVWVDQIETSSATLRIAK